MHSRWIAAFALAVPALAQIPCERLSTLSFPGVTSLTATLTDHLEVPGGRGPQQLEMPGLCKVSGNIEPEVRFELWLPAKWNRKLMVVGNGGLAGTINYNQMLPPLRRGYASSSTDTGHSSASTNDGTWALNHPERIRDFADRAIHVLAIADQAILRAFYGGAPAHSYFNGCSQGGHEALIEAQRYPQDFDGIIAGDPANNWTRHYAGGHLWTGLAMDGDAFMPPDKVELLGAKVNEQCDALDGVADGVLMDPRRCQFRPETLLCPGADAPGCLTSAQVNGVKKIWAGLRDRHGDLIYPGIVPGGEAGTGGWQNWITGVAPGKSAHLNLGIPFFRYMVFNDPEWDYHSFRFETQDGSPNDVDLMDARLGTLFNAVNPDLSVFRARGGKMIQYHGWSDPDITPLNSIDYYETVVRVNGRGGNHGLRDTKEFYRLFMVPGMQHCSGGPGATQFNMTQALEQWVEGGSAPERIVANRIVAGQLEFSRPLCPHPSEAVWDGVGDPSQSGSFRCSIVGR